MQHLEVSCAVRPIYGSFGAKGLKSISSKWGTRWRSGWGTALQIGRSRDRFPMVSEFFIDNSSGRTMALGLTQPLTEITTGNISWGVKAAGAQGWQPSHLHVSIVLKSRSLNLWASHSFIHSFIHFAFCKSIQGPKQPKGYRTCHIANNIHIE